MQITGQIPTQIKNKNIQQNIYPCNIISTMQFGYKIIHEKCEALFHSFPYSILLDYLWIKTYTEMVLRRQ